MSEWQPIETVPKDGTVVLLAGKFSGVEASAWNDKDETYPWVLLDEATPGRTNSRMDGYCTHWIPLPPPPKKP